MLAAIIPHAGQAWFLKVIGPPDQVAVHRAAFEELLKSTGFTDGKPQWPLPSGWRQEAGSGMRYATFLLGQGDEALELTVIPLPQPAGDEAEYALSNINRWRNQLGQGPITIAQLPEQSETVEFDGGVATWVDLSSPDAAAKSSPDAAAGG